ncbi:hypothetical protein REPUB_Repub11eG0117300 [Reevesia pubescens]
MELKREEPAGLGGPLFEQYLLDSRGALVERRAVVCRERLILGHCLILSVLIVQPRNLLLEQWNSAKLPTEGIRKHQDIKTPAVCHILDVTGDVATGVASVEVVLSADHRLLFCLDVLTGLTTLLHFNMKTIIRELTHPMLFGYTEAFTMYLTYC